MAAGLKSGSFGQAQTPSQMMQCQYLVTVKNHNIVDHPYPHAGRSPVAVPAMTVRVSANSPMFLSGHQVDPSTSRPARISG